MAKLSPETIADEVLAYCAEKEIQVPPGFKNDFNWHLGEAGKIATVRQFTYKICKEIEEVLATEPKERRKYGRFFRAVQRDMRWRIVLAIKETARLLQEFLTGLPEGGCWTPEHLRQWKSRDATTGEEIYGLTHRERGQFTLKEITEILGEKAEDLLKRNPFEKVEYHERSMAWARAVLKEFLKTLKSGEKWYQEKLVRWKGNGSRNGMNVRNWINKHRPAWDEQVIAEILGDEASKLLRRNPFTKIETIRWDNKRISEALKWFMSELPANIAWDIETLRKWKEKGGVRVGNRLFHWIWIKYGKFDRAVVMELLGSQARQLLERNPYRKRERSSWEAEEVVGSLMEFLATLPAGETWNMTMLCEWEKDKNNLGERLYRILYERAKGNRGALTAEAIKEILGENGENLLRRNPFSKQEKHPKWNNGRAKTAIKRYLSFLEEGQSWSQIKLHAWTEEGKKTGTNLYAWIRKRKGGLDEVVLREILGKEADRLLKRNPFQYKNTKRAA